MSTAARNRSKSADLGERLGEDHVGAGIGVGAGTVDRGGNALDTGRVGASADDEVGVAPRGYRCAQALYHVRGRNDALTVEVAAPLRVDLILQVASGQSGILQHRYGARGVQRLTESGVGVDQRGQVGGPGDLGAAGRDLGQCRQPDVGQPEVGRQRGTGYVNSLEADLGDALATSGEKAPGSRCSRPESRPARSAARLAAALDDAPIRPLIGRSPMESLAPYPALAG